MYLARNEMSLSDRATMTTLSVTGDTPVSLVAIVNSESILSTFEHGKRNTYKN